MSTTLDAPAGAESPQRSPATRTKPLASKIMKPLASLQLTVVLFALSMVLVFFGTLAQVDNGIWTVVDEYFRSWYVKVPFKLIAMFGWKFFEVPESSERCTTVIGPESDTPSLRAVIAASSHVVMVPAKILATTSGVRLSSETPSMLKATAIGLT